MAVLEGDKEKITVNLSISTNRHMSKRCPNIMLHLKEEQRIMILEDAVAWELLLNK